MKFRAAAGIKTAPKDNPGGWKCRSLAESADQLRMYLMGFTATPFTTTS
jgi:hypothetical protein